MIQIENVALDQTFIGKEVVYIPDRLLGYVERGDKIPYTEVNFGKISYLGTDQDTILIAFDGDNYSLSANPNNLRWKDNHKIKFKMW